jgi:hypothetical protein
MRHTTKHFANSDALVQTGLKVLPQHLRRISLGFTNDAYFRLLGLECQRHDGFCDLPDGSVLSQWDRFPRCSNFTSISRSCNLERDTMIGNLPIHGHTSTSTQARTLSLARRHSCTGSSRWRWLISVVSNASRYLVTSRIVHGDTGSRSSTPSARVTHGTIPRRSRRSYPRTGSKCMSSNTLLWLD